MGMSYHELVEQNMARMQREYDEFYNKSSVLTVAELMTKLQKCDQDALVVCQGYEGRGFVGGCHVAVECRNGVVYLSGDYGDDYDDEDDDDETESDLDS